MSENTTPKSQILVQNAEKSSINLTKSARIAQHFIANFSTKKSKLLLKITDSEAQMYPLGLLKICKKLVTLLLHKKLVPLSFEME